MNNDEIKIGLVGAGYWGKNLVRVFNQLGALKTICDSDEKILDERKKEFPDLTIAKNFDEVLNDKEIKGVVIATPAVTHYELAKKALLSGKDVFIEKPLALKVSEGEELLKISEEKQKIIMVGHLLLYHPAFIKIKELINKGELGDVRYVWSSRLNFGKLRKEENVLWSFAPHDISVMIDILGMPEKATAVGKDYLQKNIPDVTLSSLQFRDGKSAHIFVSWLNPFKEQKLTVIGSKAMAVFDDQAKDKLTVYRHKVNNDPTGKIEAIKAEEEIVEIENKEPLLEEAKHFLECIKERKTPKSDGKEALNVLKILDACQKSMEESDLLN